MGHRDAGFLTLPEDGQLLLNPLGGQMTLKVRDAMTSGAFSIHDNVIPAGSPGPRPHRHRDHEETFYVLEGELTVRAGEQIVRAPVGSFVVIPRGTLHQPANLSPQPTRVLLIFSPGGMDQFFVEAAEGRHPLQARPSDPATLKRLEAFTAKYGYEFGEWPGEA